MQALVVLSSCKRLPVPGRALSFELGWIEHLIEGTSDEVFRFQRPSLGQK